MRALVAFLMAVFLVTAVRGDASMCALWRTSLALQRGCPGSLDTSLRLRGRGGDLRLRLRDERRMAATRWQLPGGVQLLGGDVAVRWATGVLLCDRTGDPLETRNSLRRPAAHLLRARPTTALRDCPQRGLVVARAGGRLQWAAWTLGEQNGFSCGGRAGGVAVQRSADGDLTWSAALRAGAGSDGAGDILWECSGSDDSRCRWGGSFRLAPRAPVGSVRGIFRQTPCAAHPETSPAGWRVIWESPFLAGLAPQVEVHALRRSARGKPLPTIERRATLTLASEPWSGARVRCALTSAHLQECRGQPDAPEEKMIATTSRSTATLLARIHLAAGVEFLLRYRQSGSTLQAETPATPWPLQLRPENFEEAVADDEPLARSWDGPQGGLLWSALRWKGGAWHASVAIAATANGAGGLSAVPVRIPPGRTQWRTLGAGRWFAEAWVSRRLRDITGEFVLRSIADPSHDEIAMQFLLGWSWHRDGSLERPARGS